MKKLKITPTAFEWHNHENGHCFVDYIERSDYNDIADYHKEPLYKLSDIKLLWALYNKDDESIISIHQTFEGANKNRLLFEKHGVMNMDIDWCVIHE